jgi:hypothetical protein
MLLREILLLAMLKNKILKERFTYESQKVVKERNTFYRLMSSLDRDQYINKVTSSGNVRFYTLSDKGYLEACLKTTDHDCPRIYQNIVSGFIHFTSEG